MNERRQFLNAMLALLAGLGPALAVARDDREYRRGRDPDDDLYRRRRDIDERREYRRRRDDDDGGRRRQRGSDHRDARRRREAGEIVPLRDVLERAKGRKPGRVVDVELQRRGRRDVYRIEMLQRNGDVEVLRYDARTGEPIGR